MNKLTILSTVALLSGCSFIPDYLKPDLPVPDFWPNEPAYQAAGPITGEQKLADLEWQDFFHSPQLRQLIDMALQNNRDLRVAALNIESARAAYQIKEADMLPTITAGSGYTAQHTPKGATGTWNESSTFVYSAKLGVTAYELDLFGRVSSLEQEALEQFFTTKEAQRATQISLIAEIANAYLAWQADGKLLKLTEETLNSQQKSFDLVQRKFELGAASQLDVAQARTAVETAKNQPDHL